MNSAKFLALLRVWRYPHYYSVLRMRRWLARNNASPILVFSLPKSGSAFIREGLRSGCRLPMTHICKNRHERMIDPALLDNLFAVRGMKVDHIPASSKNIEVLRDAFTSRGLQTKFIVHYRDPRQAVLSWTHFTDKMLAGGQGARSVSTLPDDYAKWTFDDKLHYHIERNFRRYCSWIENWKQQGERLKDVNILFTNHGELVDDQEAFFNRMIDFYDIPRDLFEQPGKPKRGEFHFRSGKKDEWMETFSDAHIAAAEEIMRTFPLVSKEFLSEQLASF